MKIFRSDQVREIDEYTIKNEPVSSISLMERAAMKLFGWIAERFGRSEHFAVFAGPGNNGGDGLALARMLFKNEYSVDVYYVNISDKRSSDWEENNRRLENETDVKIKFIDNLEQFPVLDSNVIIIDGIFGSGLSRNVTGFAGDIIRKINNIDRKQVLSIDIPSGLFGEDNDGNDRNNIIRADHTLSFQFPKLSFMFADNDRYVGEWHILPIALHRRIISSMDSAYGYLENDDIRHLLKNRNKFDHKGIFGHGLFISGSAGKMGAAVLGAGAAIHTGCGLVTCHTPASGGIVLQCSLPEAMISFDRNENLITSVPDTSAFSAVGIGPGIGTEKATAEALHSLLTDCSKPVVIDADALNILSMNREWFKLLPEGAVLTPHIREFERMTGPSSGCYERLQKQLAFSSQYNCIVVLKGAHSSVTSPSGLVRFNSTGNPGMATGGSGDVLTGIILSLLAQGYDSFDAAVTGVFLHGLAGDLAVSVSSPESVIASDIINKIGEAYNKIRESILSN